MAGDKEVLMRPLDVLREASNRIWENRIRFLQTMALPLTAVIVLALREPTGPPEVLTLWCWLSLYFFFFIDLAVYAMIAITTHRLVLLGPDSIPRFGLITLTRREAKFFGLLIAVALITMLVTMPIYVASGLILEPDSVITEITFWSVAAISAYIGARFALAFPAVATDQPMTLRGAWALSRPYQVTLFVLTGAVPILIGYPTYLLDLLPEFVDTITISVYSTICLVYAVALLSVIYQRIKSQSVTRENV